MGQDDWFRSPLWGRGEEAHFEAKLARARPYSRPQYLRIKGLALAEAADPNARTAALQLFERVIASDDKHQAAFSQAHLAELIDDIGDPKRAAELYRDLLSKSGTGSALALAELILREQWTASYKEAESVLIRRAGDGPLLKDERFPDARGAGTHLETHRLPSRSSSRRPRGSRPMGAGQRKPQLYLHPDVGRIVPDSATVKEMRSLAVGMTQVPPPDAGKRPTKKRQSWNMRYHNRYHD